MGGPVGINFNLPSRLGPLLAYNTPLTEPLKVEAPENYDTIPKQTDVVVLSVSGKSNLDTTEPIPTNPSGRNYNPMEPEQTSGSNNQPRGNYSIDLDFKNMSGTAKRNWKWGSLYARGKKGSSGCSIGPGFEFSRGPLLAYTGLEYPLSFMPSAGDDKSKGGTNMALAFGFKLTF